MKKFLSLFTAALILLSFTAVASAKELSYNDYFSDVISFPQEQNHEGKRENKNIFPTDGKHFIKRGSDLIESNTELKIESDLLYMTELSELDKNFVPSDIFSDIKLSGKCRTNYFWTEGLYVVTDKNEIIILNHDGDKIKTVFSAEDGEIIKDFILSDDLCYVFSGDTIYRIYLPENKSDIIYSGIKSVNFSEFYYMISNYEVAWIEYADDFLSACKDSGIDPDLKPIDSDKFTEIITGMENKAVFRHVYYNIKYDRIIEKYWFAENGTEQIPSEWWIKMPDSMKGDADFNKTLTATDARLVLRNSVALEGITSKNICDMDADGKITSSDARIVLRLSVGLTAELSPVLTPAETKEEYMEALADSVSSDYLKAKMIWLVNDIGPRSWWFQEQHIGAGNAIYNELSSYGYSGDNLKKLSFTTNSISGLNILATIPTQAKEPDILLIMAHYDTARYTGAAVDNASGTVTLLQLAKIFAEEAEDYGIEIRFLFTSGEEQGYYGAYAYADSLTESEKQRMLPVFNIDMSSKPNKQYSPGTEYYLTVSTEPISTDGYHAPAATSNIGSDAFDEAYKLLGGTGADGYYSPVKAGAHDIIPFRKKGIEGLTVSWRIIDNKESMGSDHGLSSPGLIHTRTDNIENFDFETHFKTTRVCAAAIGELLYPYIKVQ